MTQPKHIQQRDKLLAYRKSKLRPSSIPSDWAIKNRPKLLAKENKAEAHVESALKSFGLLYTRESPVRHMGRDYFMDFAVETSLGIVCLEVDGSHHMKPCAQAADRKRERAIFDSGEACAIVRLSWKAAMRSGADLAPLLLRAAEWPGTVLLRY